MTLVRFISLSCHFIFFYVFFFSLTSFVSAGSERGGSDPAVTMERTGTLDSTFLSNIVHFASLSVFSQVQQCVFSGNTGNISGTVRGERRRKILSMDMQHPVDNRRTDGPARYSAEPIVDGWTMMTKK